MSKRRQTGALKKREEQALYLAKRLINSLEGIRGVDFGVIYKEGRRTRNRGLRFHVERKRPTGSLAPDQIIPKEILGIPCDVIEARYEPHGPSPRGIFNPIQPGISVGNLPRQTTGTLGLCVYDSHTSALCILSNWHVLCGSAECQATKDDITQPGPQHLGNNPARIIGQLLRVTDLSHGYDAAIAQTASDISLKNEALGSDLAPVGIGEPAVNMRLVKSGVSTNVTHALVDGVGGTYRMDYTEYGDTVRWMDGIHLVTDPNNPDDEISLEGDSGSVWIEPINRLAIALHFGGEDGLGPLANYAVAHPISRVFELLDIRLLPSSE